MMNTGDLVADITHSATVAEVTSWPLYVGLYAEYSFCEVHLFWKYLLVFEFPPSLLCVKNYSSCMASCVARTLSPGSLKVGVATASIRRLTVAGIDVTLHPWRDSKNKTKGLIKTFWIPIDYNALMILKLLSRRTFYRELNNIEVSSSKVLPWAPEDFSFLGDEIKIRVARRLNARRLIM